jgi:RNA polymerase sigma-70 factor (ECF subfamily)
MNLTLSRKRRGSKVKFVPIEAESEEGRQRLGEIEMANVAGRREPSPDRAAMDRETARRISDAIGELDEEFRTVVVLRDIENMEYGEISEILGIPPGTVKSRLHRGRCLLQEKLADLVD